MALVRHGSQMLFQVEKTETPLHKRCIFWVYTTMALVGLAAAVAFLVLYFKASMDNAQSFNYATQAPNSAGKDCALGCTPTPAPSSSGRR